LFLNSKKDINKIMMHPIQLSINPKTMLLKQST